MSPQSPFTPPSENLLQSPRYRVFWLASLLSNIGTWMQQVAQPWVILSMSHSSFLIGLDSFAANSPGWIFTLWGGVLADRRDRKRIILFCQSVQFFCVLLLLVLLVVGKLQIWMIIVISFLIGTTDSLSMPSFQSIIPAIVDQKDIAKAVALNSTQFNLSRLLGPAIAGLIIAQFGAIACFGANALSFIPFFISLVWIYPRHGFAVSNQISAEPPITNVNAFKKLLSDCDVRTPLATIFVTSLFCGPLMTFCPVLMKNVFHADAGQFGGAMAALGLGGLIGAGISIFLSRSSIVNRSRLATGVATLLGLIVISIALNRTLWLLIGLLIVAGACLTLSNISASSFLQEKAGRETRGKTTSLFQLALQSGLSAGGLLTGLISAQIGITKALFINGLFAIGLQSYVLISVHLKLRKAR